jgi:DnaJ family protein A protein 2
MKYQGYVLLHSGEMFFGGGGFGGGFPFMGGGRPGPVDNERYYTLLGVSKNSSDADIKKAHRKAALQHHPDKGGDAEKFKEINEAYEVLRDPEKRRVYDQVGEEAMKNGVGGGGGPADIFNMFGGHRERRGDNVVHKLKVSLDEMYKGNVRRLQLTRSVKCEICRGSCSKSGKRYTCETCRGSGVEMKMQQLGPGMMQQFQQRCSRCHGGGRSCPPDDTCDHCGGKGVVSGKKVFEVHVEPGHRHGSQVVFRGEAGSDSPDVPPGDLIFVLEQQKHSVFKRNGADLFHEKTVSLEEALTGVRFYLPHFDGRVLEVTRDDIVKPESWVCVQKEGMPIHGRPFEKGNLYINFTVKFPDDITPTQAAAIKEVFGGPPPDGAPPGADVEKVHLLPVADMEQEIKARQWNDDAGDQGEQQQRGVSCAQQ